MAITTDPQASADRGSYGLTFGNLALNCVNRVLFERRLHDGALRVYSRSDKRLRIDILRDSEPTSEPAGAITSPILPFSADCLVFLLVTWSNGKVWRVFVNDDLVYSSSSEDSPVAQCNILPESHNVAPSRAADFEAESRAARLSRVRRLGELKEKPNRIHRGRQYAFDSLKGEMQQLVDLLKMIDQGKLEHVPGMMARVRLLLADKPMGLLQRCAAYRDSFLIMFTSANPRHQYSIRPSVHLLMSGSDLETDVYWNGIDLDVWLDIQCMLIGEQLLTNLDVIRHIGDTVASHRDIDMTAPVFQLMMDKSSTPIEMNDLSTYSVRVGRIALSLARRLVNDEQHIA